MIVAIHQPNYLPWLGFFHKMAHADATVILDNVQFPKESWCNRTYVKAAEGKQWLTVPVLTKNRHLQTIRECRLVASDWNRKHLKTLVQNYSKAPHWSTLEADLAPILDSRHDSLIELNMDLIALVRRNLGIEGKLIMAGGLEAEGSGTGLLVSILKAVSATEYLCGRGSGDYLKPSLFEEAGITLRYQDFRHPSYPQLHGPFMDGLSILDAAANVGWDEVKNFLRT